MIHLRPMPLTLARAIATWESLYATFDALCPRTGRDGRRWPVGERAERARTDLLAFERLMDAEHPNWRDA